MILVPFKSESEALSNGTEIIKIEGVLIAIMSRKQKC